jgi:hypothetical protein
MTEYGDPKIQEALRKHREDLEKSLASTDSMTQVNKEVATNEANTAFLQGWAYPETKPSSTAGQPSGKQSSKPDSSAGGTGRK